MEDVSGKGVKKEKLYIRPRDNGWIMGEDWEIEVLKYMSNYSSIKILGYYYRLGSYGFNNTGINEVYRIVSRNIRT